MNKNWKAYNPDWIVEIAEKQIPERLEIIQGLKNCTKVNRESRAYIYFVNGKNPNQENSEWQF